MLKQWLNLLLMPDLRTGGLTLTPGAAHPNFVGPLMMANNAYVPLKG
ncbi:hypothetical protein [Streptomyces zaomyceticus]